MAEDTRDVLMQIVVNGSPLIAETSAIIDPDDTVMCKDLKGPKKSDAGKTKANYFAIDDFNIELGLQSDESTDADTEAENQKNRNQLVDKKINFLMQAQKNAAQGKPPMAGRSATEYARFMTASTSALRTRSYSSDLEPMQVSKQLDIASLKLFDLCKDAKLIDSAVIIKRRGGGGEYLKAFLRIEFKEMLLTELSWQDDDVVKETLKFVSRSVQVIYKPENADGTLGASNTGNWSYLNLSK